MTFNGNDSKELKELYFELESAKHISKTSCMDYSGNPEQWVVQLSVVDKSNCHETFHVFYDEPQLAIDLMRHIASIGNS